MTFVQMALIDATEAEHRGTSFSLGSARLRFRCGRGEIMANFRKTGWTTRHRGLNGGQHIKVYRGVYARGVYRCAA